MLRAENSDKKRWSAFHPWFKYGPFLILILYWLGSMTGYLFSYFEDYVAWCIPHIEGCTSISRVGRTGTGFYIYKFALIPVACLTFLYWLDMARWNIVSIPSGHTLNILPAFLGCLGAIALLFQLSFLGIDCGFCRAVRSYSTSSFFLLTFVAQWLAWIRIRELSARKWVSKLYFSLCVLLSIDLVLFTTIPMLYDDTGALEHAIAWRASYVISLAPTISACSWRHASSNN